MGSHVPILVAYDGDWIQTRTDGCWIFKSKQSRGLIVRAEVSYLDLLDEIYSLIEVDRKKFDLELKVVYDFAGYVTPTLIRNDVDVGFFMSEVRFAKERRPQLCVSIIPKNIRDTMNVRDGSSQFQLFARDTSREEKKIVNDAPEMGNAMLPSMEMCPTQMNNVDDGIENIQPFYVECAMEAKKADSLHHSDDEMKIGDGDWNDIILERVTDQPFEHAPTNNVRRKQCVRTEVVEAESIPGPIVPRKEGDLVVSASSSVSSGPLKEGDLFENKKELKTKLHLYAMKKNFEFKVVKSATDIWVTTCNDVTCKWRLRAKKLKGTDTFEIRKFIDVHTCSLDVRHRDHRQAAPWLIGQCIKDMYSRPDPTYKPRAIIEDMRKDFGFQMTYDKAWRCKEKALYYVRGTPEMSYQKLPAWCHMLEKMNPGSVTHIETDAEDKFLYFFMALGVSIRGFKSTCRPVIALDGSFLKGVYGGTLLEAIAKDANGQLYPLAFGIVDSENHNSWEWFMVRLKECLGEVPNLVFVSDRHQSIMHGLEIIFPNAHHGACIHHISMNIRSRFKTEACHEDFFIAAKQYRVSQFQRFFSRIRASNPEIATYLEDIGFEKWARAYFHGHRYDIMTTNIAESMNAVTAEARGYPIVTLMNFIRHRLQTWFCERRTEAEQATTILATQAEKNLRSLADDSQHLRVHPINHYEFNVEDGDLDGSVNLNFKSCTCRKFDLTGLPCEHALAAARYRNISVYQLCSKFYTTEAWLNSYAESIYPLGKDEDWDVPDDIKSRVVKPPFARKKRGRRKQMRRPSQGEKLVKHRRCSRCGALGHNRASCK